MTCLNRTLQVSEADKAWKLLGRFFGALNRLVRHPNLGGSCRVRQQLFSLQKELSAGLLPLLPTYDVVFTQTKKQRLTQGLVIYPTVVSKGVSGSIRRGTYKGAPIVVKVPRSMEDNSVQLVEALLHSLLVCESNKAAYLSATYQGIHVSIPEEYPIADIYFVAKSKSNLVFVGLQPLQTTLTQAIGSMRKEDLVDVLLQVASKLYSLQKQFGFMHRDLHADNVMLVRRDRPLEATYEVAGQRRTLTSRYRAYFIDFGMSCVDLSKQGQTDWAMTPGSPYDMLICEQVSCQNFSFDLRYLLGFIHTNLRSRLSFSLGPLDQLMYRTVENIDVSMYPNHTLDRHKKIAAVINVHNPAYEPLAVMQVLFDCL